MSQQATLSPSPMLFHRGPTPSGFQQYATTTSHDNTHPPFERRRTSHPYNSSVPSFQRSSGNMSERSQPQPRPRLEHRTSQTLTIDLTDDNDEAHAASPRPPRPPQLGRSDALEIANIIDLTEDNEVEITGVTARQIPINRQLPLPPLLPDSLYAPQSLPLNPPARFGSPSLLIGQAAAQPRHVNRVFAEEARPFGGGIHISRIRSEQGDIIVHGHLDLMEQLQQAMPDQMLGALAHRKPEHVPPKPAQDGFTRSPTETDIVICPSCENELIHNKELEEPVVKKGGKAPTRKEREEHPFWVVRSCGHVYCNNCYQNRVPSKHQPSTVKFREKSPTGKGTKGTPICAVEDCQSEIKNKDKWVGVFL